MICFSAMMMASFRSFYIVVTVLPLFAWCSNRRNNSIIGQPFDVERLNELTIPLGPAAHFRYGRDENKKTVDPMRIFRREKKRATFVPAEYVDNINALLQYLDRDKEYAAKKVSDPKHQVLKCLQQPSDGITCFGNGKFYQFTGSLEGLTADRISEMVRESEGTKRSETFRNGDTEIRNTAEHMPGGNGHTGFRMLWKRRSPDVSMGDQRFAAAKPYQEVLMESHGLAAGPRACYGFVAPQVVHKPKSSVSKLSVSSKKCEHRMCPCGGRGGGCDRQTRRRRLTDGKKTHAIWKRSHLMTVACRPLYVPTPKPSVNEGRIAKCRLPCGAHNCLVVPTCPCYPPCKTQAPCPSTCPPDEPIGCCTKPPDQPRCPPYEITEEPCPSFPCPAKFPFLTTPHCPCSKESCSSCSCTKDSPCNMESPCNKESPCTKDSPCGGSCSSSDKPSCNSNKKAAIITTAVAKISSGTTSRISPSVASSIVNGTIKTELTGKKTQGNATSRTETLEVEPVKLRPRMMGLWPSFDLRKLLKSAKYQNKDKTEQDKVEPLPPV